MGRRWIGITIAVGLAATAGTVEARDPKWGGLAAVALSPDGQVIVTGGENRVLYVVDANSLEVKQRLWVEARIGNLAFNSDGSRLLVEDDEENLHFFDTKTWKESGEVSKAGFISAAPAADLVAARETDSSKGSTVRFLSMTTGAVAGSATTPGKVQGFDLSADGGTLVVLSAPLDGDEKKVSSSDIPKELKGSAKEQYKRKNDGKVSTLSVHSVPSGEQTASWDLWYTTSDSDVLLAHQTGATVVFEYSNLLARVADGEVEVSESRNSYNYGKGISGDRKTVVTGGLRSATIYKIPQMTTTPFELNRIAGWPEYFEAFAVAGDGTVYAVTSAFRLARITPSGSVAKTVPIY